MTGQSKIKYDPNKHQDAEEEMCTAEKMFHLAKEARKNGLGRKIKAKDFREMDSLILRKFEEDLQEEFGSPTIQLKKH